MYERVAGRLQQLIRDVRGVSIDRDEKRELLSLLATDRTGTTLPARALSDGTLRFLALAVLDEDPEAVGVICFEEPENGIHPARVPAMLNLLEDIAVDTKRPVAADNPLRQVIVNTHSPLVVAHVAHEDLLSAETEDAGSDHGVIRRVVFKCMGETWRSNLDNPPQPISKGTLLSYLQPAVGEHAPRVRTDPPVPRTRSAPRRLRVKDSPQVRTLFDGVLVDA